PRRSHPDPTLPHHRTPAPPLSPYTPLFRSQRADEPLLGTGHRARHGGRLGIALTEGGGIHGPADLVVLIAGQAETAAVACPVFGDRKSTRLNSRHLGISYGVFCLQKNIDPL